MSGLIESIQRELLLKANIKDVCTLLDAKTSDNLNIIKFLKL